MTNPQSHQMTPLFYAEGLVARPDLRARWDEPQNWRRLEEAARAVGVCVRCGRPAHWVGDVVHCECDGTKCVCVWFEEYGLPDGA